MADGAKAEAEARHATSRAARNIAVFVGFVGKQSMVSQIGVRLGRHIQGMVMVGMET
jgi:hypothetical protein